MTLTPDMFPLTASVRESVLKRFTHPESLLRGAQIMEPQELAEYVSAYTDTSLSPLDAVLKRADELGDPTLPPPDGSAMLAWVGAAFESWEQDFPLEPALARELRKLKPVVARAALADPAFTTPGAHPVHQLLDALHAAAIGWQPDLGRSGDGVIKLLQETCANLLDTDPLGGARQLQLQIEAATESARRMLDRSTRMCQRAADVERAKLRSNHARETAATAINSFLSSAPLPDAGGEFLRGPWLESAQLVLLKFGANAAEWQQMRDATAQLVKALGPQPESPADDVQTSASAVRKSLERWLLSLQHQHEASRKVLGELEYLLLRALGGQSLERAGQALVEVASSAGGKKSGGELPAEIVTGRWLRLRLPGADTVRMQVILRQDEQRRLLLCRHSGQQPRSFGFDEFRTLLAGKAVGALRSGASFSRALAVTAGVKAAPAAAKKAPPEPAARPAEQGARTVTAAPPEQSAPQRAAKPAGTPPGEPLPLPPLGTWLGFHDVDPPLLARLAMHDPVRRLIIFVNRKGIELRRLEESQYLALIRDGMVDILETRSNFRQEVERARRRLQRYEQSQQ